MFTSMAQRLLMFRAFFISFSLILVFYGCNKSNVRWLHYDETNCADRWEYDVNNERLKDNVVEYLKKKGVKVFEIEIIVDGTKDNCSDCSCRTGRRFTCKVSKWDVKEAKSLGFY